MKLTEVKILNRYPSGSAMVYAGDKIFLAGDDARYICVLDKQLNIIDTISLQEYQEERIPKPVKHDIEAAAVLQINKEPFILLLGSGSLSPYRNTATLLNVQHKTKTIYDVQLFFDRLIQNGIQQLNIEGAATISGGLILANRGNKSYRKNQLIFTSFNFWNEQPDAPIHIMSVGVNTNSAIFNGVSGLEYSPLTDKLILTVSTEDTQDTQGDGAIGKSYIWIINDISAKKRHGAINPDVIIDLEDTDKRFANQKIESVCIIEENRKEITLALVADNDDGKSVVFTLTMPNKRL